MRLAVVLALALGPALAAPADEAAASGGPEAAVVAVATPPPGATVLAVATPQPEVPAPARSDRAPHAPARAALPAARPDRLTSYLAVRGGVFVPGGRDMARYEDGRDLEVAFGLRRDLARRSHVAGELGAGHFRTSTVTLTRAPGGAQGEERFDLRSVPVTATARLGFNADRLVLSALAGAGVHFTAMRSARALQGVGTWSVTEERAAFGVHLGGSLGLELARSVLLGLDVRRTFSSASFFGAPVRIEGLRISGAVSYRR